MEEKCENGKKQREEVGDREKKRRKEDEGE